MSCWWRGTASWLQYPLGGPVGPAPTGGLPRARIALAGGQEAAVDDEATAYATDRRVLIHIASLTQVWLARRRDSRFRLQRAGMLAAHLPGTVINPPPRPTPRFPRQFVRD